MEATAKGIDVSYAQGAIDWARARAAGVEFAIIRASYGSSGRDRRFEENAAACAALGIPFGLYHYCYAVAPEQAEVEAAHFLDLTDGKTPAYGLWLDFEEAAQTALDPAKQMEIIEAFTETLSKAGRSAGLYSYRSALERLLAAEPARFGKYDLWLAQWAAQNTFAGRCALWQHSATGSIDGIDGPVDLDLAFKDFTAQVGDDKAAAPSYEVLADKLDRIRAIVEE